MKTTLQQFSVRELTEGCNIDNKDMPLTGMGGNLIVEPALQRKFQYNEKQQKAIVQSIMNGIGIHMLSFHKREDGQYEVMDGLQRITSLCRFFKSKFRHEKKFYHQLSPTQQKTFLDYEIPVQIRSDLNSYQRGEWFKTLNTKPLIMTNQERRNAMNVCKWLTEAQDYFSRKESKSNKDEIAFNLCKDLVNVKVVNQDLLELAIKWHIYQQRRDSDEEVDAPIKDQEITEYMEAQLLEGEEGESINIKSHFKKVTEWVNDYLAPIDPEIKKKVNWGKLYAMFYGRVDKYEPVKKLVTEKIGLLDLDPKCIVNVYEYALGGGTDSRLLQPRTFSKEDKRRKFDETGGKCAYHSISGCDYESKDYNFMQMHADHIDPWSKGGKTEYSNLQLLCPSCNARKGDLYEKKLKLEEEKIALELKKEKITLDEAV